MKDKIVPVSKILTTFLEEMESIREDGIDRPAFTPPEINKITREAVKADMEPEVSADKRAINITSGTITKTSSGYQFDDGDEKKDFASIGELIEIFDLGAKEVDEADMSSQEKAGMTRRNNLKSANPEDKTKYQDMPPTRVGKKGELLPNKEMDEAGDAQPYYKELVKILKQEAKEQNSTQTNETIVNLAGKLSALFDFNFQKFVKDIGVRKENPPRKIKGGWDNYREPGRDEGPTSGW